MLDITLVSKEARNRKQRVSYTSIAALENSANLFYTAPSSLVNLAIAMR